ncbi:hypothetical protein K457DRAFT_1898402 [Linnemannia elongata AG-77]|uniref:XPG-I domain-containing protein n=1 Tax=Linnemannia elongata AG-77 TaxID=1314771 RepID=A0A197JJA4_9FUNG|nr:hypothetical protein K457DRAFT_1898402 [Linnemannia elongata AG-77]
MTRYIDGDPAKEKSLAFYYWSMESRRSFADYMTERHWTVKVVATEAGLVIAIDANPGDIIISRDSDMLAYGSIVTLWRPVSNDIILVYSIPDLLLALGITRVQLTAPAVISKYDYSRNIWSLSPTTNFSINKSINSIVTSDEIVRLRVPISWNRYRTVESPRQISKASGTTSQHQPGISQEPTFTSLGQEDQGHPALTRTRK